ncbi:DUF2442 domain-containing protein [Larkinella rosea]|uniref:DUF2442 domain-containing protein n=1 Tax=Larkinella rosea TaxID=2025312 RepID=A0A3P1BCM4_9BACT|nr:DUF2442 domain-containing protein [Larkinella rosea]RRA98799.1 DUF2442 domain-containing protein [Larkinella rosea]
MDTATLLKSLKVTAVWFDTEKVYFDLTDGKTIGSPLSWFPRLNKASDSQRQNWRLVAGGYGVHWEEIDEDLSAEGMLLYNPSQKS